MTKLKIHMEDYQKGKILWGEEELDLPVTDMTIHLRAGVPITAEAAFIVRDLDALINIAKLAEISMVSIEQRCLYCRQEMLKVYREFDNTTYWKCNC